MTKKAPTHEPHFNPTDLMLVPQVNGLGIYVEGRPLGRKYDEPLWALTYSTDNIPFPIHWFIVFLLLVNHLSLAVNGQSFLVIDGYLLNSQINQAIVIRNKVGLCGSD